jgi:hypothetical protein
MSEQLDQELQALYTTLDPARQVVDPQEWRLMKERSEWVRREYESEHAIAKAEYGAPGIVGSHGQYQWLTSVDHDISALLRLCPGVLLDRYCSGRPRITKLACLATCSEVH